MFKAIQNLSKALEQIQKENDSSLKTELSKLRKVDSSKAAKLEQKVKEMYANPERASEIQKEIAELCR